MSMTSNIITSFLVILAVTVTVHAHGEFACTYMGPGTGTETVRFGQRENGCWAARRAYGGGFYIEDDGGFTHMGWTVNEDKTTTVAFYNTDDCSDEGSKNVLVATPGEVDEPVPFSLVYWFDEYEPTEWKCKTYSYDQ